MSTDTLTLNSRTGDVDASEIERIMRGEDLIRVDNDDILDLFDINGLRRKIALTLTPVLHSTNLMRDMLFGLTLLIGAIVYAMIVPMTASVAAQTITGAIACIAGVMSINTLFSDDKNIKPTQMLSRVIIGAVISSVTAIVAFKVLPSSGLGDTPLFKEVMKVLGLTALCVFSLFKFKDLYRKCFRFAEAAVSIRSDSYTINGRTRNGSWDDNLTPEQFAQRHDIPDSIKYSLLNHVEDTKYNQMIFCKPVLDLNKYDANEKMKREVARDPAVLLSDGKHMYLVGAWDIAEDHQAIMAEANVSNQVKIHEATDLADRLGKKAKQELLGALKAKANRLQAEAN